MNKKCSNCKHSCKINYKNYYECNYKDLKNGSRLKKPDDTCQCYDKK